MPRTLQRLSQSFDSRRFIGDVAQDSLESVHKCGGSLFEVVAMDIEMPKMGGVAATRLIKEFNPSMPVVVLTMYATGVDLTERCQADKILMKPTRLSTLEGEGRALLRPIAGSTQSARHRRPLRRALYSP
ncbi:MAG: response regulator [Candidatus Hydrogenedentes bacterium]|nr:response regulator [Candidatus Hydrogenedentota bacterium]